MLGIDRSFGYPTALIPCERTLRIKNRSPHLLFSHRKTMKPKHPKLQSGMSAKPNASFAHNVSISYRGIDDLRGVEAGEMLLEPGSRCQVDPTPRSPSCSRYLGE